MDYDSAAEAYGNTRWALPWIVTPLAEALVAKGNKLDVLDIGCGTGDYLAALSVLHPDCRFAGFDLSERMADIARSRCSNAIIRAGDAGRRFPFADATADVMICVNVLHHLTAYEGFFSEVRRIARPGSSLLVATDSGEDILGRSLAKLFPETVALNLARYPTIDELVRLARAGGLVLIDVRGASGELEFDDRFIATIEQRGISELRLISEDAYTRGLDRVRDARARGEKWLSRTTVLRFDLEPKSD
jgi:SAM-dependent methyltransferase